MRRNAVHTANSRLNEVTSASTNTKEIANAINIALVGLVADLLGEEQTGMTPQDAATLLGDEEVSTEVIQQFTTLLGTCDAARYGADEGSAATWLESARTLVPTLVAELGAR